MNIDEFVEVEEPITIVPMTLQERVDAATLHAVEDEFVEVEEDEDEDEPEDDRPTYWLCEDCAQAAVNNDLSGLDYYYSPKRARQREREITQGLETLGWVYPTEEEDELSTDSCDCCETNLAGKRFKFIGEK